MKVALRRMIGRGVRWTHYPLVGLLLLAATVSMGGQVPDGIKTTDDGVKYARGQNIVPVFEGWVPNADGTFSLLFGYFNRNWEEDVFIPVGPNNHIDPGGPDLGQPTVFTPRRERNKFEVVVPKDFGNKEVVWTVTHRGKTEKAFGALVPAEVLSRKMVLASVQREFTDDDTGDATSTNTPPKVDIAAVPPLTLPARATLNLSVTDDAVPVAGYRFGGGRRSVQAINVNWSTFRGPALVSFEPAAGKILDAKGGKLTAAATFRVPGTYVLRAAVVDVGGYLTNKDITVVVK
jgi:hypothetical protein